MKNSNKKRGFTIVELIIVIAVIAILAAVLIPTFSSLINKSLVAADESLVRNLNEALAMDVTNPHNTMTDALKATKENGFDVSKINARASTDGKKHEILWDSRNDCFVYEKGGEINYIPKSNTKGDATPVELWHIANDGTLSEKYSNYLAAGTYNSTLKITMGLDVGEHKEVTEVNYTNTNGKQDVVIRTNSASTTLTINVYDNGSKCDTVNHFGVVGKLVAVNAGMSSYHENGKACFVEVQKGKIVAENQSEITVLHAKTANVAVVENGGEIKGAYATTDINTSNTANGGNKTLVVTTDQEIQNKGNAAKDEAVENEMADNVLKDNIDAIAYIKDGNVITPYNTLEDAVNAVAENGATTTINICKDYVWADTLVIQNKNINFVGKGATNPVITGAIKIQHTSGNHAISFDNIQFTNNTKNDHLADVSTCSSAEDVNRLTIINCLFYENETARPNDRAQRSVVAICAAAEGGRTGTQLVFKNNIVKTIDYDTKNANAYYNVAITTSGIYSNKSYGDNIYNYAMHEIEGNQFLGHFHSIIAGGYAKVVNNVFDGKYYNRETVAVTSRAFQFRGTVGYETGTQFNMTVANNTFKNLGQIFKLYTDDRMLGQPNVSLDISGSNDGTKNTFENISNLGEADSKAASMLTKLSAEWTLVSKQWTGIITPTLTVAMDKIDMFLSGTLETGYLTLCNGTQVMTYTQPLHSASGRTGYWLKDENEVTYWYFCTFNGNINYFLKDGTNEVYVAILGGGGDCKSLKIKELAPEPNWVTDDKVNNATTQKEYKYYDGVGTSKVGALYKSAFTIETFDGNTVYNGTAQQSNNKVTITARSESSDINLFISNVNGCSKLLVTTNASATADSNTYVVVVPGAIGQLVVSGTFDVVIDVDIANVTVLGAQSVTINEGKTVAGILKITGTDAIGASVINNGKIGSLYVYAKTTVTNNGEITSALIGNSLPGGVSAKLKTVKEAYESTIINNGTIMTLHAITKITLMNNSNASIDGLTIAFLDAGMQYAKGSIITNSGSMCNLAHGNINLYVQCSFTNEGTIGKSGRETGASSNCGCENVGGCINIGYWGYSDAHDGLVFNNSGTIYAGARHNGAHQQYTFWIWGVYNGYGTSAPVVTINNDRGNIEGVNWRNGDTQAVTLINGNWNW